MLDSLLNSYKSFTLYYQRNYFLWNHQSEKTGERTGNGEMVSMFVLGGGSRWALGSAHNQAHICCCNILV